MPDQFSDIDTSYPLSLLPVRLEAKFFDRRLRVRIYPDVIHANGHSETLTDFEAAAGFAYWSALWVDKGENAEQTTLERDRLATLVGARRALHVATETTPKNWGDWSAGKADFPDLTTIDALPPVSAGLLPDFWTWRLYDLSQAEIMRGRCPNDVQRGLCMAPTFGAAEDPIEPERTDDDEISAFLKAQNLRWMVDFKAAIKAGMAFEIPFGDMMPRFGSLLVAGIRRQETPGDAAEMLNDQFRAHWFTHGFDVLPTGTVTNNSDAGHTDQSAELPDMDALFAQNDERRPLLAAGRAALVGASPPALLKMPAADTLSVALGLNFTNILDRTPNAERLDGLGGASFNTLVGAGLGTFFTDRVATELGGGAPIGGSFNEIRRHHVDWVRAAGPIPSLRVGAQPYGVLPVRARLDAATASKTDAPLITVILDLFVPLLASLPVATLDPDATDGIPDANPDQSVTALLEVLGAVPNPHALHLRPFHTNDEADIAAVKGALDAVEGIFNDAIPMVGAGWDVHLAGYRARITGVPNTHEPDAQAPSLADQRAEVEALKSWVLLGWIAPPWQGDVIDVIEREIDPLLDAYEEAWDAMPRILRAYFDRGGISDPPPAVTKPDSLMNYVHATYDADAFPVATTVSDDGTLGALDALLDLAIAKLADPDLVDDRASLLDGAAPLLHWLIDQAWQRVATGDAGELGAALVLLRGRIAEVFDAEADDPALAEVVAELDRLMREALSLFMNRLDAWVTSFAARRLAELRAKTPRGVQIGGYGWLLDLTKTREPVSQGFIHTHSMNHAATAAVLRSGWAGYGTSEATAPLSVNLTSDRMRAAIWLLDAVRGGADLAEVLGARFERMLHEDDLSLDRCIDDVRMIANAGRGLPRPEAQIADGIVIARAFSADPTTEEQAVQADLLTLASPVAGSSGAARRNRRLRMLYRALADELDAVADVTMAQSVHALAQGKDSQSGAVLNMLGDQEGAIPEIDLPYMPRRARVVTHRIAAICPPDSGAPRTDPLAASEPALADWLTARLPDAADVATVVQARRRNGRYRRIGVVALSALGLSPVEMMALCARAATQDGSPLARLLRAHAIDTLAARLADPATLRLRLDTGHGARMSFDRFGVLAGSVRDALTRMRALTVEDLTAPGATPTATVDATALPGRVADLLSVLQGLQTDLEAAEPAAILPIAARLAAIGITGAIILAEAPESAEIRQSVLDALAKRIEALQSDEGTDASRLAAACGNVMTILPPVTLSSSGDVAGSLGNALLADDVARDGPAWFRQARRVSVGADALGEALELAGVVAATDPDTCGVVQLPHLDEAWAALSNPTADQRDRTCIYVASGFAHLAAGQTIAGMVAATFADAIPAAEQQTGLAVHFDSPSARPPQVILLSMLDKPDRIAIDDQLYTQLQNTLQLTKMRAVGTDRIAGLGHIAPATYLRGDVEIAEIPT